MRIGSLRKRLTLQSESLVPDGAGGRAPSWNTLAAVWGEIIPEGGSQAVTGNSDRRSTHVIRLRMRPDLDIKTGMRLLEGNRVFMIRAVADADERNRWLDLQAEEGGLLG